MPGHRLHIQQIPLIPRPTLHRSIVPNLQISAADQHSYSGVS